MGFCCDFDVVPQHLVILGIFHVLVEHLYFLEEMPIQALATFDQIVHVSVELLEFFIYVYSDSLEVICRGFFIIYFAMGSCHVTQAA